MSTTDPSEVLSPLAATTPGETYNGCVLEAKDDVVEVDKGVSSDVDWTIKDENGNPIDLSPWIDPNDPAKVGNKVVIGWTDCTERCFLVNPPPVATVVSAENGHIVFSVPDKILAVAGIYSFYATVVLTDGRRMVTRKGYLMVRWSPWMIPGQINSHQRIPTVADVRQEVDDFVAKNDLMKQVEYTSHDILDALVTVVQYWNDQSPYELRLRYTCSTFPFFREWIRGAVVFLLERSVAHYMRNKMQIAGGGLAVDEKNRDENYLRLCELHKKQWVLWLQQSKRSLNAQLGWSAARSVRPMHFGRF